ncbi:hypothetical protein BY996DRAFT_6495290 [Phakopsora pachyrhizi]|uniref:Secreted protein n=1 Tax=Phakopsora pachyrhizi TaxID=170000 RepID=A0AAV0BR25_PHAPC|nr:hypothetical protein BY996DRAFT_6495290 [Phakopsora pachyrhizi]CAH7688634.1 hypothetical protein PPACK8108_LOCUS23616 [Phakopsora pachyrhizi]
MSKLSHAIGSTSVVWCPYRRCDIGTSCTEEHICGGTGLMGICEQYGHNCYAILQAVKVNRFQGADTDGHCLDINTPDNEYDRGPTNRNKKVVLNEDQPQWVVVIRGICWEEEAQTDGFDYDLR